MIPYKRTGEPEEIGRAAVWLASDESEYIQAATLLSTAARQYIPVSILEIKP
jgi:glucose 1-dehydrogenase